jgi:hypothetical protein
LNGATTGDFLRNVEAWAEMGHFRPSNSEHSGRPGIRSFFVFEMFTDRDGKI